MIDLQDVQFTYPGSERGTGPVRFHLQRGEHVAIVGSSGCGKSTLLRLMAGLYAPDSGHILWDGQSLSLDELRSRTAYVPQDAVIFQTSLYHNIHWAKPETTSSEVAYAAKKAHIHDFIASLPQGYETPVTEQSLSGGQRRRIAIARAILKNSDLILLDEITASLDPDVSRQLMAELKETFEGKTLVMVTHDVSALPFMDRIIEMPAYSPLKKPENSL